ncbi:MAG: 3-hydroxyacyl-CoA dehydrogenase family protein [Bdellovibrio sp.]|nr:3-hydroxyacyl-CoA dehydrogenase family protein [Bdellovibrio sp.]
MQNIKTIGVIGAGTMGSSIAQHFIMKGLRVILVDAKDEFLEKGRKAIQNSLNEAVERKLLKKEDQDKISNSVSYTTKKETLSACEFIVEAIYEDLQIKKSLFKELETIVTPHCVLATNTSSFLISDIVSELKNRKQVLGVHYFYPAAKNKLVEIISTFHTQDGLGKEVLDFYTKIDKTPILVQDSPGFAINRFFVPWLNEACRLYEEGYGSVSFIDDIAKTIFGISMGPFALMNATGVPIALHAASGLANKLGSFYQPALILKEQVSLNKPWDLKSANILKGGKNNPEIVEKRLFSVCFRIASQLVSEGVTDEISVDLGARVGLRWPKGPFALMNEKPEYK